MATPKRITRLKIGAYIIKRRYSTNPAAMHQTQHLPAGTVYKIIDIRQSIAGPVYVLMLASGKDGTHHHINATCLPAFNLTRPYINVPKYGMAYHTIRYWQTQAADLWRFNGIRAGGGELTRMNPDTPARMIGHAAIQLAVTTGPLTIARILAGEMVVERGGAIVLK